MQPKTLGNVLTPDYCSDALLGAKGKATFFWVWVGFPLQGMVVPLISHPGIDLYDFVFLILNFSLSGGSFWVCCEVECSSFFSCGYIDRIDPASFIEKTILCPLQ